MDIEKLKNKYLKKSHCCILCDSDNIEGGSIEVDGGGASQEITCKDCGAYWDDLYVLVDVVNLHLGGEDDG